MFLYFQRRDYGVLAPFLPPKHEYVLFITLSDVQVKLYQYYLDNYSRRYVKSKAYLIYNLSLLSQTKKKVILTFFFQP